MHVNSTRPTPTTQSMTPARKEQVQFGGIGLTQFLSSLEKRPLAELVFKDIAAFNIPKIALVRTWKERLDTATLELSNTAITLVSSMFLPQMLRRGVSKVSGIAVEDLKREIPYTLQGNTPTSVKLARLGTSFSFFFPFSASFWAAPFFRNWLTMNRTQSADFESMIGFSGVEKTPRRSLADEMAYQKRTALQVVGVGLALGAASLFGFGLAAKNSGTLAKQLTHRLDNQWKKPWNWFFQKFDLKGKGAYQIAGGPATLLFWGAPAYLGWVHAARSNNERRERVLQSMNAIFWFFFAPVLTSMLWHKPFLKVAGNPELWKREFKEAIQQNMLPHENFDEKFKSKIASLSYNDIEKYFQGTPEQYRKLTHLKNWKFGISGLGIPISSLAMVQAFNFHLTEQKIKQKQMVSSQVARSYVPQPPATMPPEPTFAQTNNNPFQVFTTGVPSRV